MATTSENILGKCAKLIRASRTCILKNISVDWGVPSEKPRKAGYSFPPVLFKREFTVLRSPSKIDSIYPGHRLVVTAIIKGEAFKIPDEVVLRAQRDGKSEPSEVRVPVQVVQPTLDDDTIPLVNTLAARRITTELEDPKKESQHSQEQKKATIIRIGEEYQLASRYTSFVAVGDQILEPQQGSSQEKTKGKAREGGGRAGHVKGPSLSRFVGSLFGPSGSEAPTEIVEETCEDGEGTDLDDDWDFTTLVQDDLPYYCIMGGTPGPRSGGLKRKLRAIGAMFGAPPPPSVSHSSAPIPSAQTYDDPVLCLVRLQAFDGSFTLNDEFREIIGEDVTDQEKGATDDTIWATALAIAYLRQYLADEPELLEGLVEKALDFVSQSPLARGVDFEALVEKAKGLV